MKLRLVAIWVVLTGLLVATSSVKDNLEAQGGGPAIFGAAGTLSHGGTLTISGSSFGTRPTAAPLKYDDFQSVALGQQIVTSTAPGPAWFNNAGFAGNLFNPIATATRLRPGTPYTRNMQSHWQQPEGGGVNTASTIALINQQFGKVYFDAWMYNDTSAGSGMDGGENVKHIRMHQVGAGAPNVGFTDTGPAGSQFFSIAGDGKLNNFTMGGYATASQIYNRWVHIQWAIDAAGGGTTTSGKVRVYVDGALRSTSDSASLLNSGFSTWPEMYIGNYWRSGDWTGHVYAFWESMYVDQVWSRVEIGNNATYNNCTQREVQIPTAWSDGSVTVKINRGSFASLSSLFLFVVNEAGVASPGFALGGTGALPTAPSNLRIIPGS